MNTPDRGPGSWVTQQGFDIRFGWGEAGVRTLVPVVDAVVIVDVLSFCTAVDVAVGAGVVVHPFRWKDERAQERAEALGAMLAGRRGGGGPSLSPPSLADLPRGAHVVLPSPNGSTLSLATGGVPTFAGCLRNASAVAAAAARRGRTVAVIAAGERWPDGSLRPAVEDLVGAGAILARLPGTASPEACAAIAAWREAVADMPSFLRECASGRELLGIGFACDVDAAAAVDVSAAAPRLVAGPARYEDISA